MAVDISGISYFIPIFSFLFVFVVVYALLAKTKLLGENMFVHALVSFVVAIIFATLGNTRQYVETVTPWFVILVVALFFILIIIGFSQAKMEDMMKPWLAWVFIILLIIVFLLAAIKIYGSTLTPVYLDVKSFVSKEKIFGAILLLVVAVIASWIIAKK